MKRIASLVVGLLCTASLYGQGVQVGIRTGLSSWYYVSSINGRLSQSEDHNNYFNIPNKTRDIEVYCRAETKHCAFDIGVNYYKYQSTASGYQLVFDDDSYYYSKNSSTVATELKVMVQYKLLDMDRWKNYLGLNPTLQFLKTKVIKDIIIDGPEKTPYQEQYTYTDLQPSFGVGYYSCYTLSKPLTINGSILYNQFVTSNYKVYDAADTRFTISLGMGYKL